MLKENLYPFTKEYIFGKKTRGQIRTISDDYVLSFQINLFMDTLERLEEAFEQLFVQIQKAGAPFMPQIGILTSMSGISVITALAVIADIIDVSRFRNSKHFASYLRSTPTVESSNDKTVIKSTSKAGRKLSITLLSQSLNHFRDANQKCNRWYERVSVYKKKGVVRMALCRRVITEIYQMLKKKEYHYFRKAVLHEKKLSFTGIESRYGIFALYTKKIIGSAEYRRFLKIYHFLKKLFLSNIFYLFFC